MEEINVTEKNFQSEVLSCAKPVLVDFFANWCGPCKMMAPIISQIARECGGVKVCKIDIDACAEIAIKYNIMSIPTVALFENGSEVKRIVGVTQKDELCEAFGIK